MRLQNQQYTVTTSVETKPFLTLFDFVYNLNNTNTDDYYMARVFYVTSGDGNLTSIAFVDLVCAEYEPHAVLEKDQLTFILFDYIVRLDLATGSIVSTRNCDNSGGLLEIYPIEDGYIIHGECDIFRFDYKLNQVWRFTGRDILVSAEKDRHFWIKDQTIHCRDFSGWHYVLNLDGVLIHEFQES